MKNSGGLIIIMFKYLLFKNSKAFSRVIQKYVQLYNVSMITDLLFGNVDNLEVEKNHLAKKHGHME